MRFAAGIAATSEVAGTNPAVAGIAARKVRFVLEMIVTEALLSMLGKHTGECSRAPTIPHPVTVVRAGETSGVALHIP